MYIDKATPTCCLVSRPARACFLANLMNFSLLTFVLHYQWCGRSLQEPFSKVFETETTEEHRPSLQKKNQGKTGVFLFIQVSSMSTTPR